jgi:hypothetical protein
MNSQKFADSMFDLAGHLIREELSFELLQTEAKEQEEEREYPVLRDLYDLTDAKCAMLLDAVRLYTTQQRDSLTYSEQQDCAEVLAQLCVLVRK